MFVIASLFLPAMSAAQHSSHDHSAKADVEPQPLLAQAIRLKEALSFLGSSLSPQDTKRLEVLQHSTPGEETTKRIQEILDPYCLAVVNINPEARVKVSRGSAVAKLMQGG